MILIIYTLILIIVFITYNYYTLYTSTANYSKKNIINTLVRQASRWSVAAFQDTNPLIAVLHANYGAAYLFALKDIYTDYDIEQVANIDIKKFTNDIIKIQDTSTQKMAKLCPKYAPSKPKYLAKLGKEI
jgi:hypothetical protein